MLVKTKKILSGTLFIIGSLFITFPASATLKSLTDGSELKINFNSPASSVYRDIDDVSLLNFTLENNVAADLKVAEITFTQFGSIDRENLEDLKLVD